MCAIIEPGSPGAAFEMFYKAFTKHCFGGEDVALRFARVTCQSKNVHFFCDEVLAVHSTCLLMKSSLNC